MATFTLISNIGNIVKAIGLNAHAGLILVYMGGSMGMNIWLMKGYLDTILGHRRIGHAGWRHTFPNLLALVAAFAAPDFVCGGDSSFIGTYGDFYSPACC